MAPIRIGLTAKVCQSAGPRQTDYSICHPTRGRWTQRSGKGGWGRSRCNFGRSMWGLRTSQPQPARPKPKYVPKGGNSPVSARARAARTVAFSCTRRPANCTQPYPPTQKHGTGHAAAIEAGMWRCVTLGMLCSSYAPPLRAISTLALNGAELVDQCPAADAELLRGLGTVAAAFL